MKKIFLTLCIALAFAHAESVAPTENETEHHSGWMGLSLGFSSVAGSVTPALSVRGGTSLGSWRLGLWASTIVNDVAHPDHAKENLDYDAIGALIEPVVYSHERFSLSIPLLAGAGFLNYNIQGVEESQSDGAFFIGDAGLLVSYQLNHSVRLAAGGGYRLTYGIEKRGLSDGDFRTPYGEVQLVYGGY